MTWAVFDWVLRFVLIVCLVVTAGLIVWNVRTMRKLDRINGQITAQLAEADELVREIERRGKQ